MLGDVALATENSRKGLAIATENDLALSRAWSTGVVGWCTAENGDLQGGIALLTSAIAAMQAIQSRHFMGYLIGLLAHVQMKAGHHTEAARAVTEGLSLAEASAECFYAAELHRLRGELSLYPSPNGRNRNAELSFQKAIAIARQQRARALERKARRNLQRLIE